MTTKIAKKILPPKEKRIKYIKELSKNGFNKTQALHAVNPNMSYDSAQANSTREYNRLMDLDGIDIIELQDISPEYIIGGVRHAINDSEDSATKLNGYKLLGQWRKLWSDAPIITNIQQITIEDAKAIECIFKRDSQPIDVK